MQELQIFKNEKFGEVRIEVVNGKELFCASDVANCLGYKNPRKAISDHCKGVTKCDILTDVESLKKQWFDIIEDKEVI